MKVVVLLVVLSVLFSSVYSRQIKWTGQGGTNLWDFARNWDCNCIPTYSDDVSIDSPFSASNIRIGGSGATANSLVVGGSSQFTQSLYVQGALTIGPGGGKIASNGVVTLDSAPSLPFTSQGPFNAGSNLIFNSGALAGTGSFTFSYLNLTGPALKVFNASSVTVTYMLEVLPGSGNTGVVDVAGGVLTVTGDLTTVEALTLSVYPNARFNAKGAVVFAATGSKTFTFRGYSLVANLTIKAGNVVVNDNSDFGSVDIGSGGFLTLIGAASATRTFSSVTGAGSVVVQGGTNSFSSMSVTTVQVQSGIFQTDSYLSVVSFQVTGGVLSGSGTVQGNQVGLANAVINSLTVVASTLSLNGISSLNGSILAANQSGVVTVSSQLTMANGATFWVAPGATFSQGSPLKLLPSGSVPSLVQNDGSWTSTSQLTSVVNVVGTGSWNLGNGAAFTITGVNFTANALSLTSAAFTAQAAVVTLQTVSGSSFGTIYFQGSQFNAQNLDVYTYVHTGGNTVYNTGTLNNITITTGTVTVSNSTTISTVDFRGGNFNGNAGSQARVSATKTVLTTAQPKYLNNINVTSKSISLLCPGSCQLFTTNAVLQTPSTEDEASQQ